MLRVPTRWRCAAAALAWLAFGFGFEPLRSATPSTEQIEFFENEIRPLLAAHCYSCHSSRTETPFAGLRLDSRDGLLQGGDSGPAIVPGNPDKSRLLQLVRGEPLLMPPTGRLPEGKIDALASWIRMGASWTEVPADQDEQSGVFDLEARKRAHWAWQPVRAGDPPAVRDSEWPTNVVDRFVLAKLEERGLRPASSADRHPLIRRLTYDLTGLPPTPGEIRAFVRDTSPDAYERLVRRLLDSKHFGERWASHWMDLVRYADSHGSEGDPGTPGAWRYRDYLIRALNRDIPYDQLVREHLAGDLLEHPRIERSEKVNESILGTAHLRVLELGYQPVDPWEERVKWTDNQIEVFSKAFQGLTISCARCHDHKFDAISQQDYYALFGVFYGARPTMRAIDDPQTLLLHTEKLQDLKARIRAALAAEWIPAAERVGQRLWDADATAVRRALEEAACDESSPLHAWLKLRGHEDAQVRESWRRLQKSWRLEAQERQGFNDEHFERIWDLSGSDYSRWLGHGSGFSGQPSSPGRVPDPARGRPCARRTVSRRSLHAPSFDEALRSDAVASLRNRHGLHQRARAGRRDQLRATDHRELPLATCRHLPPALQPT